uniref:Uncharacterized protein n=1 Tax=viral metagenome TaxID=1070528 RepID=A0A6M3M843_9ZZZZ
MRELDELIRMVEAKLPAQPESEDNQRLAKGLENDIAEYFRQVEMAFPWDAIEQLYYQKVKP